MWSISKKTKIRGAPDWFNAYFPFHRSEGGKKCKVVHTLRFSIFSPGRKNGKSACWGPPHPPARAAPAALPNAPQVKRLRAVSSAEYERLDRLEKNMLTASGRTRSRPVMDDEKRPPVRPFSRLIPPNFTKVCCKKLLTQYRADMRKPA